MSARSTALAIAIGSATGAVAALFGSPAATPPPPASAPVTAAMKPIAQVSNATPPVASVRVSSSQPPTVSASSAPSGNASASPASIPALAASSAAAPAAPVPSTANALPPPSAPLPSTKAELLRVEMRCDQKDAAECDLAAAAYEQGSAGVTDPAKAANYRKIALTHWLSQCDKNSPTACITLADRYRAGNGVPQSDRNADALIERSRELCKVNPAAACADLPKSAAR
ncbi:MAG TPA: hypothetical protein VGM29_14830 [Polyangiaceae bacterium]